MTEFDDAIQDETIEPTPPIAPTDTRKQDTYEELITVTLTDDDKATKRERLETVDREIIRLEVEKKAAAKVFTNQIKPLEAERDSILQALDEGTEKRPVECYELFDDRLGKVEVRRVDTDEVVEERAMTQAEREDAAEERQGSLFDAGGSQPPPAAEDDDSDEDLEPDPEALAQGAVDEGRVVRTSAKEARAKRAKRGQVEQGAE